MSEEMIHNLDEENLDHLMDEAFLDLNFDDPENEAIINAVSNTILHSNAKDEKKKRRWLIVIFFICSVLGVSVTAFFVGKTDNKIFKTNKQTPKQNIKNETSIDNEHIENFLKTNKTRDEIDVKEIQSTRLNADNSTQKNESKGSIKESKSEKTGVKKTNANIKEEKDKVFKNLTSLKSSLKKETKQSAITNSLKKSESKTKPLNNKANLNSKPENKNAPTSTALFAANKTEDMDTPANHEKENVIKINKSEKQVETVVPKQSDSTAVQNHLAEKVETKYDTLHNESNNVSLSDTSKLDTKIAASSPNEPSLGNWQRRVGLGFEAANFETSYGIFGEAVYKKHWSFSLGVNLMRSNFESFSDNTDFYHQKDLNFKNYYSTYLKDTSIYNIHIKNIILQVPISFGYSILLSHNFSLLLNSGTSVDLMATQQVQYTGQTTPPYLNVEKFHTTSTFVSFNNVFISVGLQKQVKRFVIQLSPFMSPELRKVYFKRNDAYYGVRLRIYYSF